jgi:nucleoid DNA-binding protein
MKVVTKKKIVSKLHKRLGKSLSKDLLQDSINTILLMLKENLTKDVAVSINNFGTFSPYTYHGHIGLDVSNYTIRRTKKFRTVKFRPHVVFLELLAICREDFV